MACSSVLADESELTGILRTRHFIVHHNPDDPYLAKLMARSAENQLKHIADSLDYELEPGKPFPLYVYPTHKGFLDAGGLNERKYTVGTASSVNERISVDASGILALPEEVLGHEITHAVIFRILGEKSALLPLWVNEGMAKYYSEEVTTADDRILSSAAAENRLIPLYKLEDEFPEGRNALAYAISSSAIRYLIETHGESAPRELLQELNKSGSFEDALVAVTGLSPSEFADTWYDYVTERYWHLRFSRVVAQIGGAIMAILVIAAFIVRRKQKKEAVKRWEEEELIEAIHRQQGNDWSS